MSGGDVIRSLVRGCYERIWCRAIFSKWVIKVTWFLSMGSWYGFYVRRTNLVRIGLGLLEIGWTWGERGHSVDFLDGVMGTSGAAAREIEEEPLTTGRKLPVGFVSLENGQQAEMRIELEANSEKYLGREVLNDIPGENDSVTAEDSPDDE
jgi:hypothetical protein